MVYLGYGNNQRCTERLDCNALHANLLPFIYHCRENSSGHNSGCLRSKGRQAQCPEVQIPVPGHASRSRGRQLPPGFSTPRWSNHTRQLRPLANIHAHQTTATTHAAPQRGRQPTEQRKHVSAAAHLHQEVDDLARDVARDAVDVHVAAAGDPAGGAAHTAAQAPTAGTS